tara:strand:- start:1028 stop:1495 length:468 start_codon:yes stop_codon:yes gene_type:complete
MVIEMRADHNKMATMGLSNLSLKLCKEKIRYYTYLHNSNVPMAKASLVKIEAVWQEIHYEVTFEDDNKHICMVLENTKSIDIDEDDNSMYIKKQGEGNFANRVTDKDTENSLMMGDRMVLEMKEHNIMLRQVIQVLDIMEAKHKMKMNIVNIRNI